ncbi:sensor domain-containing diguanylate cyclase [Massilia varians]|uniref:GGDEF domain-containing protein n=1 Tax=Massilia varians TaxID=457921 RepID=UPI002556EFD1|nr:sensor domain-containing diguanylate cyclase [Massilia varians]
MITSQLAARRRNIKLVACGILLVAGIALASAFGWSSWQLRRLQLASVEVSTTNLAQALADQASSVFKTADTVLVGMVDRIEHDGLNASSKAALHPLMMAHMAQLPALQGLFVYDASGNWIVNSAGRSFNGRNNADRAYFIHHRRSQDRGVRIGAPIIGRTSGVWVIPVSRRLEHADGSFAGVVLATIKVDFFRRIYERIELHRDGKILLALQDGTQLLGHPFTHTDIGADLKRTAFFPALAASLPTGALHTNVERGRTLFYGVRRVGSYPLLLAIVRSRDQVLEPWRESILAAGAAFLALAAGMAALGAYLARQMRQRDRLERRLLQAKTALETSNASLLRQSRVDPLTGLFNRRYLEQALEQETARACADGSPLAALMIDVDYFKKYNDTHGHLAGDVALSEVARAIRDGASGPGHMAARFGGEEFVVLMPGTDAAGATRVAEAIRARLRLRCIAHSAAPSGIMTVSIGLACGFGEADNAEAGRLVERADAALYAAKEAGRDCIRVDAIFDPDQ